MACFERCAWISFGLCVILGGCSEQPSAPSIGSIQAGLSSAFSSQQTVDVIITLRDPPLGSSAAIGQLHDRVLADLGTGFSLSRRLRHAPVLAGRLDRAGFERLQREPDLVYVQLDERGSAQLKEAVPAAGVDQVVSRYKLTGRGVRIAVLDSGVDLTHPDLTNAIVEQHCIVSRGCPPLFSNEGTNAQDDHGHGTYVAGVIASRGTVSPPGFAPEAEIIAVKITDQNNSGQMSDWIAGLDWVFEHREELKIDLVNVSVGSNTLYTADSCATQQPALARSIKNLVDAGVTVFAASGNRGSRDSMSAPACSAGAIAVAASYDSDVGPQPTASPGYAWPAVGFAGCSDATTEAGKITCFSNTSARLDLVAPGAPILTDGLRGVAASSWGTSLASAAATGVAALLKQCNPGLKPDELKQALVDTGKPSVDPKNDLSFPVVRALEAVRAACKDLDADPAAPSPNAGAHAAAREPMRAGQSGGDRSLTSASERGSILGSRYVAGSIATRADPGTVDVAAADTPASGTGGSQGPLPVASKPAAHSGGCSCRAPAGAAVHTSAFAIGGCLGVLGLARVRQRSRARRAKHAGASHGG